jgi:DNA polymerase III sliding clamp (beta) subunit (PCNA family)
MLETLKFVRGAVAVKDLVPILTHFHIYNGKIQGFNGRIAIEAPAPKDSLLDRTDITVPATKFLAALDACKGQAQLAVEKDQLIISASSITVRLALATHTDFPQVQRVTAGTTISYKPDLIPLLKILKPFISTHAFHVWSCGILFKPDGLYATNSIALVKIPFEWNGPIINLPAMAVEEIVRIEEEPESVVVDKDTANVTFNYSGGKWLSAGLFDAAWPDTVDEYLRAKPKRNGVDPKQLLAAVEQIAPFCPDIDKVIQLGADGVSTLDGVTQARVSGAAYPQAKFRADSLVEVLRIAETIDLAAYPKPCPFRGSDKIEGVIVGMD